MVSEKHQEETKKKRRRRRRIYLFLVLSQYELKLTFVVDVFSLLIVYYYICFVLLVTF